MSKPAAVISDPNRRILKTDDLYLGRTRAGGIVPAFNNIYDVTIDFAGDRTSTLANHIKSTVLYEHDEPPGSYLSLFCSEALLPGSQFQTSSVDGLRQGLQQQYALYRRYPDINLTWYSQRDYFTNDVFNAWMEFITPPDIGGDVITLDQKLQKPNAGRRMRYPDSYKCNMEITSFSRDAASPSYITYHIRRAFPTNIVAAPLAYGKAELIKTTVSFAYETYYIGRQGSSANVTKANSNGIDLPFNAPIDIDGSDPLPRETTLGNEEPSRTILTPESGTSLDSKPLPPSATKPLPDVFNSPGERSLGTP